MDDSLCDVDGLQLPRRTVSSAAEVGELVRAAAASAEAVYPTGGGTNRNHGRPPTVKGVALDLRGLNGVIDYPARDMTVTVQAGITLADLREVLGKEDQRLPVDVPHADRATLGGALAANTSGLRRYGLGTLRDYLIGISVVNDEGQEVKGGGRVVKNVAGYDLCKLFIGSFGTLGVITQATLKVVPRPEQSALLLLSAPADGLPALLDRLHETRTRPVCVEALNPGAATRLNAGSGLELAPDRWLVIVGFESNAAAVNWQVQQTVMELKTAYSLEARVGPTAQPLWDALTDFPSLEEARLTLRASVLPGRCAELCRQLDALDRPLLQAHAGNGVVAGHYTGELDAARAAALVNQWCEAVAPAGGSVVVTRCPPAWKAQVSVWGPERPDVAVMRSIKQSLDPRNLFNPGRYLPGLYR